MPRTDHNLPTYNESSGLSSMNGNRRGLTLHKEKRATTDDGQKLQLCTRAGLGGPIEIVFYGFTRIR